MVGQSDCARCGRLSDDLPTPLRPPVDTGAGDRGGASAKFAVAAETVCCREGVDSDTHTHTHTGERQVVKRGDFRDVMRVRLGEGAVDFPAEVCPLSAEGEGLEKHHDFRFFKRQVKLRVNFLFLFKNDQINKVSRAEVACLSKVSGANCRQHVMMDAAYRWHV